MHDGHDIIANQSEISVKKAIFDTNDAIADSTNHHLTHHGVFAVNVMGAPGVGKTSCILQLAKALKDTKIYVVEGDIESDIDTVKLRENGIEALQINTHGSCHLDAPLVHNNLDDFVHNGSGILFIENIGNLVCPAEFMIGEHIKMLIVTCADGSDKPYKYPLAFEKADVILLNKSDLAVACDFDANFFMKGVRALNKNAPVFPLCAKDGKGFENLSVWLKEKAADVLH